MIFVLRGFCVPIIKKETLVHAYTDASIRRSSGGIGFFSPTYDFSAKVEEKKDINRLELGAIFAGISLTEPDIDMILHSDSQTALNSLTSYKKTKYDKLAEFVLQLVSERSGNIFVTKVKAHSGNRGNDMADRLAGIGTNSSIEFVLPDEFSSLDEWRNYMYASKPIDKNTRTYK